MLLLGDDRTCFSFATDGCSISIQFFKPMKLLNFGDVPIQPNYADYDRFIGIDPGKTTCFTGVLNVKDPLILDTKSLYNEFFYLYYLD